MLHTTKTMKAVMFMFDTLSRRFLSTYGNTWVKTPNFERLKKQSVQFNNFYSGSLPCMPARREIHTGRYNFLHRGWGPIEPYDVSSMELLKSKGIYTHICTDHSHYWEDGGSTYLPRYTTWEGFRGQEGDRWVGCVNAAKRLNVPKQCSTTKMQESFYINYANRTRQSDEADFSSVKTVKAGINFIDENIHEDNWFLQIECFDPHEPFYVPEQYLKLYDEIQKDIYFDWPSNAPVCESEEEKQQVITRYAALISMCDHYLGELLDKFDQHDLWKDTLLIVNTDHGFLTGEHDWWGKNIQPLYNEVVHLPFYIYDPRQKSNGEREALAQTIDIAPTLLDFFGCDIPKTMQGHSLLSVIKDDHPIREAGLFGSFGGAINVTDGQHVYIRSCINSKNEPAYEYTLMPTKLRGFLSLNALKNTTLTNEFECFDHTNVLKIKSSGFMSSYRFGNKLFDLQTDSTQSKPLDDINLELEMIEKMRKVMVENEAPSEQYERIGIQATRAMTHEELLAQRKLRSDDEILPLSFEVSEDERAQILFVRDMMGETKTAALYEYLETNHNQQSVFTSLEMLATQVFMERGIGKGMLIMFLGSLKTAGKKD